MSTKGKAAEFAVRVADILEGRERVTPSDVKLWHRRLVYEGGVVDDSYFLELTREQFLTLGGHELTDKTDA